MGNDPLQSTRRRRMVMMMTWIDMGKSSVVVVAAVAWYDGESVMKKVEV